MRVTSQAFLFFGWDTSSPKVLFISRQNYLVRCFFLTFYVTKSPVLRMGRVHQSVYICAMVFVLRRLSFSPTIVQVFFLSIY